MQSIKFVPRTWLWELGLYAPIYFFFAFFNLRTKLLLTPAWFDGALVNNHHALMSFDYYNNEQSRVLQYLIPEFIQRIGGMTTEHAYIFTRFVFVFVAFVCFHFYLRRWFRPVGALAGVASFAALMQITFSDDLQESSPLLLVTFLVALWAIRDHRTGLLLAAFFVGGLTNETMLILPSVYFFYNFTTWKIRDLAMLVGKTLAISVPLLITILPIRYATRFLPHLGGAWHLPDNLAGIANSFQMDWLDLYEGRYLFIFFVYGALWVYAVMRFSTKPLFLQRASLMIPLFILSHMLTGVIQESRQMLPLAFIVLPMAFFFLFPSEAQTE